MTFLFFFQSGNLPVKKPVVPKKKKEKNKKHERAFETSRFAPLRSRERISPRVGTLGMKCALIATCALINDAIATTAGLLLCTRALAWPAAEIKEVCLAKRSDLQCYKCRGTAVCLLRAVIRHPLSPPPLPPFPPLSGTYPSSFRFFPPLNSPFLGRWPPLSGSAFANHHPLHLAPPQPLRQIWHYTPAGTYSMSVATERIVSDSLPSEEDHLVNSLI